MLRDVVKFSAEAFAAAVVVTSFLDEYLSGTVSMTVTCVLNAVTVG